MKFFTRALLERYGSLDDRVADAAHEEWEQATQRYHEQLHDLRRSLPTGFVSLLDQIPLHDASVATWGCFPSRFYIGLAESGAARVPLLLTYKIHPARQQRVTLTACADLQAVPVRTEWPKGCYWLYDEAHLVDAGAPRTFSHTILLSDGRELAIPFTDFEWSREPLLSESEEAEMLASFGKQPSLAELIAELEAEAEGE